MVGGLILMPYTTIYVGNSAGALDALVVGDPITVTQLWVNCFWRMMGLTGWQSSWIVFILCLLSTNVGIFLSSNSLKLSLFIFCIKSSELYDPKLTFPSTFYISFTLSALSFSDILFYINYVSLYTFSTLPLADHSWPRMSILFLIGYICNKFGFLLLSAVAMFCSIFVPPI